MCQVLNKHRDRITPGAVYIGRGSKWGNPFRIGSDGDRAGVIARHEAWLRDQHALLRALDELRGSLGGDASEAAPCGRPECAARRVAHDFFSQP